MNVFLSWLNEQQRRWYVALEAERIGHGGTERLAQITGMNVNTIRRGRRELAAGMARRSLNASMTTSLVCRQMDRNGCE